MIASSMIFALIFVFIITFVGTIIVSGLLRFLGSAGYLNNLFPNVRGGIPRGVGIIPFIVLSFYMPSNVNNLILIIGITAFIDDLLGRKMSPFGIEWGQISRGIGIILVMIVGIYEGLGLSSIFIALMVQPLNIADMQPGSCCIVTIIMSFLTMVAGLIIGSSAFGDLPAVYIPLLLMVVCIAYSPMDFSGRIMLGEVGNHSFAVALGLAFYAMGGLLGVIIFGIITTAFIAFVRRNTLVVFFRRELGLYNPTFGDFFMDVLTGGGLGDLFRLLILKNKQYTVTNHLLISLGFRRLLYNPVNRPSREPAPKFYTPSSARRR